MTIFYITFMHLADAFIQSDLECIQAIHFYYQYVFPGNWSYNLLRELDLKIKCDQIF